MDEKNVTPEGQASEPTKKSRRDFVKTSAQVAVTAPAVAMLLSNRPAKASVVSNYGASSSHILDDFTFGNNHEDVDAKSLRNSPANFSNFNQKPIADDHV